MKVVTVRPNTDEWLAARQAGIGASEIAAVMGLSPFESPFGLWWRKRAGTSLQLSPELEWGHRLESAIADKFADDHPELLVEGSRLVEGPEPWMLATPDRIVGTRVLPPLLFPGTDDPARWALPDTWLGPSAVLEVKRGFPNEQWGDAGTAQIPVYYRAQVQWQMLCTGLDTAYLAALLGQADYREYVVRRDERDIAVMVEYGRRFRASLDRDEPPDLDGHHATLIALREMHPSLDGSTAVVGDVVAAGYRRAIALQRRAAVAKDLWEARLRGEMGAASRAVDRHFQPLASRSVYEVGGRVQTVSSYVVDRINALGLKRASRKVQ